MPEKGAAPNDPEPSSCCCPVPGARFGDRMFVDEPRLLSACIIRLAAMLPLVLSLLALDSFCAGGSSSCLAPGTSTGGCRVSPGGGILRTLRMILILPVSLPSHLISISCSSCGVIGSEAFSGWFAIISRVRVIRGLRFTMPIPMKSSPVCLKSSSQTSMRSLWGTRSRRRRRVWFHCGLEVFSHVRERTKPGGDEMEKAQ
mmetsp:Transcript_12906/g.31099  ORF Transcript_12906/g.31099 Transcript_12906/m.31099 type:complete len:201 (-) Transcript_12906:815-1417(-)